MVAAGYGTTLIPGLAAGAAQDAGLVLRPLAARASRTVRIAWRVRFPRRAAVAAVGEVIAARLSGFTAAEAQNAPNSEPSRISTTSATIGPRAATTNRSP
jgi:LysR family hydrogen peroxide-inducible transcriptional activator